MTINNSVSVTFCHHETMHEVPSLATYNFKLPLGGGGEGHALRPPWVGLPLQALLYAVYYASLATYENFNIPENPE